MDKKPPSPRRIKAARLALKESQTKFAARLHVNQATIHRWETRGVPSRGAARVAIKALLDELGAA